ncbi:MAG: ribonuclease H-like domain-containing protein [Thaumarchaeota archaeon]|nr:ribonuclease H-like domain-containing protein [Candidatus Calditenuaceae archaeon]MDW8041512.1 ribonuclease H-like domain-containing protein [Nitrososphaerota archaeon]
MRARPVVAALDIETTSLHADVGHLVCAVLGDYWTGRLRAHVVRRPAEEGPVLERVVEGIGRAHVLLTWRGRDFDVPWLVTRSIKLNVDPRPLYNPRHIDLADVVGREMKLSNSSLWNVARFLGLSREEPTTGADVPSLYEGALLGNRAGMTRIVRHCREDVKLTLKVARRLRGLLQQLHPDLPNLS